MAFLRLSLLGGFEAVLASGTRLVLPTRKAQALLAYCALRPTQIHQREKLATLLWGETEDANARNSLRQTLYVLRSALGESASGTLRVERDAVSARPSAIEVDALSFERFAAEQTPESLEQAAALYRGDLLEGFVVDEEPFEEWLLEERERLRDLAMETLARLLQHQRLEGAATAAIHTARRLLALDPLQEIVHRLLMRLLVQAGRPDEALNQFEVCRRVLKRELGLEPEVETTMLRDSTFAGLRSARVDQSRDPVRPHAFESAAPALDIDETPQGLAEVASDPVPTNGERAQGLDSASLLVRLFRVKDETQRLRTESLKQRAQLQRAWQENYKQIIAVKRFLLSTGAPGSGIVTAGEVADPA